jgi:hypothetical protein
MFTTHEQRANPPKPVEAAIGVSCTMSNSYLAQFVMCDGTWWSGKSLVTQMRF